MLLEKRLNGLLKSFESLKISSTISLLLTLVIFFGFYLSIFITLPSLGSQINSLLQNLPTIVVAFQETLGELAVTYDDVFSEEDINSLFLNFDTSKSISFSEVLVSIFKSNVGSFLSSNSI